MKRANPTTESIEAAAMWSSLAIYFFVWSYGLSAGFERSGLFAALAVTSVYVGMHVYEITRRHHCYLSADSTAAPATLIFTAGLLFLLNRNDEWSRHEILAFVSRGFLVFIAAHIAALVYSAFFCMALERVFSRRTIRKDQGHEQK